MTIDVVHGIKVSKNWDCVYSLTHLIEISKFVYQDKSYQGALPKLVLKEKVLIEDTGALYFDTIILGYDRWGLTTEGVTNFSPVVFEPTDYSKDVITFLKDFLDKEGATDLVQKENNSK